MTDQNTEPIDRVNRGLDGLPALDRFGRDLERVRTTKSAGPGLRASALRGAASSVAVFGVLAFTPPGQAVAEWMGELVGVGDVGGSATSQPTGGLTGPKVDGEAIVFANGVAPDGRGFEVVAYRSRDFPPAGVEPTAPSLGAAICVRTDFPSSAVYDAGPAAVGAFCYSGRPTERGVRMTMASAPNGSLPFATVSGEANSDAERISVTYPAANGSKQTIEAAVAHLGGDLGERIGVPRITEPTTYFVAFLPDYQAPGKFSQQPERVGPGLLLEAFDQRGQRIAVDDHSDPEGLARWELGGAPAPAPVFGR